MRSRLVSARRTAQTRILRLIRSSPVFPDTIVNRLGEDESYEHRGLPGRVMVYFPGALDTLYQIRPWLPTFQAVHEAHGMVVVCQDSRVAEALRRETRIPAATIARYGTLDGILTRSRIALVLYVSHQPRNFEALRFASVLHAYIGHGDSDKGVSASNQLKAYDVVFAPGQAAIDRIAARLMRFDAAAHTVIVGQPLTLAARPVPKPRGTRIGVLYAPTWEGAQPSVAYSSVLTHGLAMVTALIGDGRFTVVYRPHPLVGVTSGAYAAADLAIRQAVATAADTDPAAGHRVVPPADEALEASFARADVLITDVSAVTTAWLPTLRPLVVTTPAGEAAVDADSGLLEILPRVTASAATRIAALVAGLAADDPVAAERERLVAQYLSPYWPDRVMERFVEVCGQVIDERDVARAALESRGATGV